MMKPRRILLIINSQEKLTTYQLKSDAPINWANSFQDSATTIMNEIKELHDYLMYYLILILIAISIIFFFVLSPPLPSLKISGRHFFNKLLTVTGIPSPTGSAEVTETEVTETEVIGWGTIISRKNFDHNSLLELVWTIIPAIILVFIAIPSFNLLYGIDEEFSPLITLKVQGSQWYWTYAISDNYGGFQNGYEFDSYLIPTEELIKGDYRLLEVDNSIVLPINTNIRVIITSADVLHSWSVNAAGIKMDAIPGRLNQIGLNLNRSGVYYGQCSELCGVGHALMPIKIEAVKPEEYIMWVSQTQTI
jgi:cytochrome c oxidase subunit 2